MKLKNNSIGPKVIHYINNSGARKSVTIETNGVVEIVNYGRFVNEVEIQNGWVSIVNDEVEVEVLTEEQKMKKATKDVESYMSESDVKTEKKNAQKKIKNS